MAKLLYVGTHASDDPTKAGLVFRAANGTTEAGHEPQVALLGEAVNLMREEVAASTIGPGLGPTSELMATAISNGTPIYI